MFQIPYKKNVTVNVTRDANEFDEKTSPEEKKQLNKALEYIDDCLNMACLVASTNGYQVKRYHAFLSDHEELNAFANEDKLVFFKSVVLQSAKMVLFLFTEENMRELGINTADCFDLIETKIMIYAWRFMTLHELFHIWNGHLKWLNRYYFNYCGKLMKKTGNNDVRISMETKQTVECTDAADMLHINSPEAFETLAIRQQLDKNQIKALLSRLTRIQSNLTMQAIELDADRCAICQLINMMKEEALLKGVNEIDYLTQEIPYLVAGIQAELFLFEIKGTPTGFDNLRDRLFAFDHPLNALRSFFIQEQARLMLDLTYSMEETDKLYNEWADMVIKIDSLMLKKFGAPVFWMTAFCEASQRHLITLKKRYNAMYSTLGQFFEGLHESKFHPLELEDTSMVIWYRDDGTPIE